MLDLRLVFCRDVLQSVLFCCHKAVTAQVILHMQQGPDVGNGGNQTAAVCYHSLQTFCSISFNVSQKGRHTVTKVIVVVVNLFLLKKKINKIVHLMHFQVINRQCDFQFHCGFKIKLPCSYRVM